MDGRVGHQGLGSLRPPADPAELEPPVPSAALEALDTLRARGVRACLLRPPGARPARGPAEIDLLAADDRLLPGALLEAGFVAIPSPGHGPHRFFLHYDDRVGEWLKLDVVTALSYGRFHELSTRAGTACLERARMAAGVLRLDPADELWTLLLHCLLDKGTIRDDHARRLGELALASTAGSCLESEIRPILPDGWTPERAVASVRAADWPALEALGRELARSWERRRPVATRAARLRARATRKAYRLLVGARPRGCRVALLGPDGAGKSTVSSRLAETFPLRVHTVYAGLYPAGSRRRRRVPGLGLAQKVVRLRIASARARLRQRRGSLVVFDRYPYDAILPTDLTSWRARARRRLLASSCARPDLTVLLDAPAEVLFRRSGEHGVEALEAQRSRYRALESRLSLAVVDTVGDPDDVLRRVTALVWGEYVRRARRSG